MSITPELSSLNIVLRGRFNPAILSPSWFGWQGLLSKSDVMHADLKVTHPEISVFSIDWFHLEVSQDKFNIETTQPPEIRISDLVIRIFREKLESTPIHAMGINRQVHFSAPTFKSRVDLGRTFAPIDPWDVPSPNRSFSIKDERSGMSSLTVSHIDPPDRSPGGSINVTVEPSKKIGTDGTGVFVSVNDHYSVKDKDELYGCSEIMDVLSSQFEASLYRSSSIISHIIALSESLR